MRPVKILSLCLFLTFVSFPARAQWVKKGRNVYYEGGSAVVVSGNTRVHIKSTGNYNSGVAMSNNNSNYKIWEIGNRGSTNRLYFDFKDTSGKWLSRMTILRNGYVGIGTANPKYLLSVNGTLKAREIIASAQGWSDFVFAPGYQLMPLTALEQSIKSNGHLPGIPAQKEVSARGVNLAVMQAKLLEKVEELTLYIIAQDKEIAALKKRVGELEKYR